MINDWLEGFGTGFFVGVFVSAWLYNKLLTPLLKRVKREMEELGILED